MSLHCFLERVVFLGLKYSLTKTELMSFVLSVPEILSQLCLKMSEEALIGVKKQEGCSVSVYY
jgi:hypothetical protein